MAVALGVTASVIAVTTLAWDSSKRLYDLVDGLNNAPEAISHTKASLSTTQNALQTLKHNLTTENSAAFDMLLRRFRMVEALEGSHKECDRFSRKIETYTKHSKDVTFSKRDRFIVNFHDSEIKQFNGRLQDHWQAIMLVTTSMNLYVSSYIILPLRLTILRILSKASTADVQQLSERFARQETELNALNAHLSQQLDNLQIHSPSDRADENTITAAEDRDWSIESTSKLQSICQDSISAVSEERPIKQTFGDVSADKSRYYEGIAGKAQGNVTQTHGKAVVTGGSAAARGQMDADTFKIMFGSR